LTPLVLVALALGAAPARYNDRVAAPPRSPLVSHIEDLARKLAPKPLDIEPRLERAAAEIARRAPPSGPPPNELVQAALWLHGLVEPPPHLVVVTMSAGAEEGPLLDELKAQLPRVIASGNYRRLGVAAETVGDKTNVVVALQESFVELDPIPRALPAGGAAVVKGRIFGPYVRPEVLVTAPGGQVTRLFVSARDDVKKFTASLHCLGMGRHQVEITGDDRFGPAVLANFPVDCGLPAPTELVAGQRVEPEGAAAVKDAAQAEAEIFKLANQDRQRAGLPPLQLDRRLTKVARAHSEDMVQHHFVGHVSPTTGSAADRLKSAHVPAQLILENVARAYSPGEIERGLMESPGHRANLLNDEVTHLGVGVALGDGQNNELFATQLFVKAPEALPGSDAGDWQAELKRRIAALRRAHELPPLVEDARLDQIAADTAVELAKKRSTSSGAQEILGRAIGSANFGTRYRAVKSGVAITTDLPQAVTSLERPLAEKSAVGVGVGVGRQGESVYVVILIGNR
jgi:uncharacterized protein YkwD